MSSNDPDLIVSVNRLCHVCDGTGTFTETVEADNGRDIEIDYRCGQCDGTGSE